MPATATRKPTREEIELEKQREFEASFERHRRVTEKERALKSSFDFRAAELLVAAEIFAPDDASQETKDEAEQLQKKVGEARQLAQTSLKELAAQLDDAVESGDFGQVTVLVESRRFDQATICQTIGAIWRDRLTLANKLADELQGLPQQRVDEAEVIVADVKRSLTEIGCGLEAQPAWPADCGAAEITLDHLARRHNLRGRAAMAIAHDANVTLANLRAIVNESRRGLARAKDFIEETAMKLIRG